VQIEESWAVREQRAVMLKQDALPGYARAFVSYVTQPHPALDDD
jgi:hypothetical protein